MSTNNIEISVVVPTYNEESRICECITSLTKQSVANKIEIIIVDDGSSDSTVKNVKDYIYLNSYPNIHLFCQSHLGPGIARNHGGKYSKGKVLVFVDADMVFDRDFIKILTKPILMNKVIGTSTLDEHFANPENFWAKCWNIGRFAAVDTQKGNPLKEIIVNKSNYGGIFRAISKKEFNRVGGFDKSGDYTDDETLAKKLGAKAMLVRGAKLYHYNPSTFTEVYQRALWIGSGKNFTNTFNMKLLNIIRFSFPISLIKAVIIAFKYKSPDFIFFKIIYDTAIWISVMKSIL